MDKLWKARSLVLRPGASGAYRRGDMRLAIGVDRNGRIVHGSARPISDCRMLIADRDANGESFIDERAVRIPRRLTRTDHQRWLWCNRRWEMIEFIGLGF